jgi:ribosome-binding protein aMBF1 (putative translation factor)
LEEVEPEPDALESAEQRWMDHYAADLCNIRKTARRPRVSRLYLDLDGVRLQERREALGYSLNKLSHEFRCSASSIKRWEDGDIVLQGLMAVGADTVLRRLERVRRAEGVEG